MPAMPESDPKYLRPSIHQSIAVELDILAKAVASGDLTQVKALVKLHPTVTYVTNGLLTAVNRDQPQIGEYLLNRVNVIDRDVVAMVVRKKELRWFEMLTKRGWDVNTPVLDGIPALCSLLRDETLVKFFLAEGADPKLDTLILNVCASTSTPAVFDLLLSHGARLHFSFPLHAAAGSNDDAERIPMMEHLVQKHCLDVNSAGDGEGAYRPLHYAVRAGGSEKVKWLLNKGADPRLKNKKGFTALEEAKRTAYTSIIKLLQNQ